MVALRRRIVVRQIRRVPAVGVGVAVIGGSPLRALELREPPDALQTGQIARHMALAAIATAIDLCSYLVGCRDLSNVLSILFDS
jgi:hypothetical protein